MPTSPSGAASSPPRCTAPTRPPMAMANSAGNSPRSTRSGQRRVRIGRSLLRYPSCAVIRLDDIALDRECETDAIAPADLVVCQVEDELSRRPLPRGVGSGPATRVPTSHERGDSGGSRGQQRQRILRTHEICVGERSEQEANDMAPK